MLEIVFYVAILLVLVWIGSHRRKEVERNYSQAGGELGLRARGTGLEGQLDGYVVSAKRVTRTHHDSDSSVQSVVLHVELLTAPPDLIVERETLRSNLAKHVGKHDITVGDAAFDKRFLVACTLDGPTLEWFANSNRRDLLLALDGRVDEFELRRGALEIEVPTDPVEPEQVTEVMRWLVAVGRRIDDPTLGELPDLTLQVRETGGGRPGVFNRILHALSMIGVLGVIAVVGLLKYRTHVQTVERDDQAADDAAFVYCVDNTPKSPDVDMAPCAALYEAVNPDAPEVVDAHRKMLIVQARKLARVELDHDRAARALAALEGTLDRRGSFGQANVVPMYWDHGLLDAYFERERDKDGFLPDAADSIDVLFHLGTASGGRRHRRYADFVNAARCLAGDRAYVPSSDLGDQLNLACQPGRELSSQSMRSDGGYLMGLELDAERARTHSTTRHRLDPEAADQARLMELGHRLAAGEPLSAIPFAAELADSLQPAACWSPWDVHEAFGDPAVWLAAAPTAGPFEPRLRLLAARQASLLGKPELLAPALDGLQLGSVEAVCAVQVETLHDPPAALARLAKRAVTEDETTEAFADLTRGYAHALIGEWAAAEAQAWSALKRLDGVDDQRFPAMLIVTAAAMQKKADGLDERFGEIGEPQDASNALAVTRWFGRAASDDVDDASDRWIAPAELTLLPGAEPLQFIVAGRLAPGAEERWLDMLLPSSGFDALGVATARRVAAQVRGDADAVAKWTKLERKHRAKVTTPAMAQVYRLARLHSPGRDSGR